MVKLADSTMRYGGTLTAGELRQLDQKALALGSWRQGQPENALLIIEGLLSEPMTERVAAEVWTAKAGFQGETGDYQACLETLSIAYPFIHHADLEVQGIFYYQLAKSHKELGNTDAAITEYSGAAVFLGEAGLKDREAVAYNSLAYLYLKIGDRVRARECIDQAMSIDLNGSEFECQIFDTLAEIELAEGCLENALESINRALAQVGENDRWRTDFLATKDKIETELLRVLGVETIKDLETVRVNMTRRALQKTEGNLSRAGKLLGVDHRGVDWIISKHPELEIFRKPRQEKRLKSIVKHPK